MNFLKKLVLSISVLAVVNVASAGYDPVTGRFHQQDPLGRGPRIVHTSHGPQWVGTNGPQIRDPRPVAPNPMAGLENIGRNPNMDYAMAQMNSVGRPNIHPQVADQQLSARLKNQVQTAVISVHNAQSQLQTGRWLAQEQLAMPEDQYLDGMNLYQYVGSNPINFVDPLGLSTVQVCIRPLNKWPVKNSWVMVHCFIKSSDCGNWNYNNKGIGKEPNPGGVGKQTSKCVTVKCECDVCCMIKKSTWSGGDYKFLKHNCCHWVDSILKKSKCGKGVESLFPGYHLPTHPDYE